MRATIIFVFLSFFTWSCSEEENIDDVRDQAVGSYNYEMKVYEMTAAGLLHIDLSDVNGTFELMKGTEAAAIEAKEGELITFIGENVQKTENGFTFEVKDQTGSASGAEITLQGYNGITYDGAEYQGRYLSTAKTITVNFTFTGKGRDFVVKVLGTKSK